VTRTLPLLAFSAILFVCSLASSAQAQSSIRTYVSVSGSDSNPCSLTAPCRHFSAAVALTSAGGEVDALDPGGYGSFTIGQAISIEGQGWSYVAPADGGVAIAIDSPTGGAVSIRGVSINGVGTTGDTNGIVYSSSGGTLDLQNSLILGFPNAGIDFAPGGGGSLYIADTLIAGNAVGVEINSGNSGTLDHVRVEKNTNNGITTAAAFSLSISNSVLAGNGTSSDGCGLSVNSGTVTVTDDVIVNNGNGICETNAGLLFIRNSTMTNSVSSGLTLNGGQTEVTRSTITGFSGTGTLDSYGDNNLLNGSGPSPVITATFPLQ
jgi:hypothetical protein